MNTIVTNHLIESTLFAVLMGLLTLCFTDNRASVRYGLWLAASVKFLVPFSAVAAAGKALRWKTAPAVALYQPGDLPRLMTDALPDLPIPHLAVPPPLADAVLAPLTALPAAITHGASRPDMATVLFAVWLAGCGFLICRWVVRWLCLCAVRAISTAAPIDAAIPVRFSRTLFEPGLAGIFRPVLLLPEGITAQLSPAQLAFVIEHELCHWRRRDNLTAAVHMTAELVFWFHPLIWWIGTRLIAERERACDESVLAAYSDPKGYANSLLEVCRFYIRSPLACAPGVAGGNLTHRVERIMENVKSIHLSPAKLALLTTVAAAALLLPLASGLLTPSAAAAVTQDPLLAPPLVEASPAVLPTHKPPPQWARPAANQRPAIQVADATPFTVQRAAPQEPIVVASASADTSPDTSRVRAVPPGTPTEEIVITGKQIREFVRTHNFVRSYTAPSEFLDQISRWHQALCVHTEGLAPAYNAFITKRVKDIATEVGAPKPQEGACKTNLDIIFSKQPQAVLDYISKKRPDLLGPHYPAARKTLATVSHPVQAWYATGTRDTRGHWQIDTYDGWGETVDGSPPVYYVPGSHLDSGLTSEFASVVVVADAAKVQDWEIGTTADYIAMLAFARTNTLDKCQQVPSVANLAGGCEGSVTAKALTDYDVAYLKALYMTSANTSRNLQESGISSTMLKILEKQVAEKKAPEKKAGGRKGS